jgi:hypothetical protein
MATAVIGGIMVSTVLSLVVVPAFYLIMDDLSWLLGKVFGRLLGQKEEEPEAPENAILAERIGHDIDIRRQVRGAPCAMVRHTFTGSTRAEWGRCRCSSTPSGASRLAYIDLSVGAPRRICAGSVRATTTMAVSESFPSHASHRQ